MARRKTDELCKERAEVLELAFWLRVACGSVVKNDLPAGENAAGEAKTGK
jgi:hypothetical protein